eukprot:Gb_07090 [translate_table: standard]
MTSLILLLSLVRPFDVRLRKVPPNLTLLGMIFSPSPLSMNVTVTTWLSRGSVSRETSCCKLNTAKDVARIGSADMCGKAACPPFPSTTASKHPEPAKSGPGLEAIEPVDRSGATCIANIASASPSAPS